MSNVIDLEPYITFIQGKYRAFEEDDFIESHPQIKSLLPYLYEKQQEFINIEAEKFMERIRKNEECKQILMDRNK